MDTWMIVAVTVVVTLVVAALAWYGWRRWRSKKLKHRFGPEYERTVAETGDRTEAEEQLEERQKRVKEYDLRPLSGEDRQRFSRRWEEVQRRFVDEPSAAISDAHRLVEEVMGARGYPLGDINRQQEDISVEDPEVVPHYREAREIALRNEKGEASTEDLREAMIHYRELFESLLVGGEHAEKSGKKEKGGVEVG